MQNNKGVFRPTDKFGLRIISIFDHNQSLGTVFSIFVCGPWKNKIIKLVSFLLLQSSRWGRMLYLNCLLAVRYISVHSLFLMVPCVGLHSFVWLWYFLIILTNFLTGLCQQFMLVFIFISSSINSGLLHTNTVKYKGKYVYCLNGSALSLLLSTGIRLCIKAFPGCTVYIKYEHAYNRTNHCIQGSKFEFFFMLNSTKQDIYYANKC